MIKIETYSNLNVSGVPDHQVNVYQTKKYRTALLIPILNEGDRILKQLLELESTNLPVDIILADGGSSDLTQELIEKRNMNVRAILVKHGKGALSAQLRMGFHYCVSQDYESVITMDGNNKDDASGLNEILSALHLGMDFVQGSRFIKGGKAINTPFLRYAAIRLIHAPITSLAARFWFTDTTNGFRGHSKNLIIHPSIQIFRECFTSYELLAYLPIRSKRIGLKVCEVPVARRYPKIGPTPTKISGYRAQFRLLKILIQAASGRFDPF
jgi:dolichol-phosphate mannosyltransferase